MCESEWLRVFYFIFFISIFYKKIYFRFGNLQKYIPAAPLPGGRDLAGRQGLIRKKKTKKNCRQVPGAGRPAAGRSAPLAAQQLGGRPPLAARLLGGRLSHPYIRVGWSPTPHLHHYNSRKKRERGRERERRNPAGFSGRRL